MGIAIHTQFPDIILQDGWLSQVEQAGLVLDKHEELLLARVLDQILPVIILRRWQDDEIRALHYPGTAPCEEKEQFLIIFSQHQTAWLLVLLARMSPHCMDTLLPLGVLVQMPEALQLQTGLTKKNSELS